MGAVEVQTGPHRQWVRSPGIAEAHRKCLPAVSQGQTQASWLWIWWEPQCPQSSVPILFLHTSPQGTCLVFDVSGGLSLTVYCLQRPLTPGPETHPRGGSPKLRWLQPCWPLDLKQGHALPTSGSDCHN